MSLLFLTPTGDLEASSRSTWDRIRSIIAQETTMRFDQIARDIPWQSVATDPITVSAIECSLEDEFRIVIDGRKSDLCITFGELEIYVEKLLPVRSGS